MGMYRSTVVVMGVHVSPLGRGARSRRYILPGALHPACRSQPAAAVDAYKAAHASLETFFHLHGRPPVRIQRFNSQV